MTTSVWLVSVLERTLLVWLPENYPNSPQELPVSWERLSEKITVAVMQYLKWKFSALDPAGLLYNLLPQSMKLKKGDAKFIDTIMTNQGFFGLSELVGDINFMPSGGRMQKACEKAIFSKEQITFLFHFDAMMILILVNFRQRMQSSYGCRVLRRISRQGHVRFHR